MVPVLLLAYSIMGECWCGGEDGTIDRRIVDDVHHSNNSEVSTM